ncbi:MAG: hypothetical protein BGP23_13345 [Lysobacterales bacterium 66-474]|nr:MAG: hypothetical protein ABT18_10120 [Rhodanobacter sp. SCN 66-43]OJY83642.1 MAG: hypothetical protein BGP23_13345 [Xanthomonadales bacterium 66-474]
MMRVLAMLVCMAAAMLAFHPARAQTQVQVTDTWPAGDTVTLGQNQSFYLHLHYTSEQPVHIWARPYFQGKPAKAGSNPSRVYPAGSGEALGWFFLFDPGTQVDEVRISAGDGSYNRTPVVATYPVSITGGDEPVQDTPQPAWLAALRAADKAAQDADYHRTMNTPPSAGEIALFNGFMLAMVAFGLLSFAWPAWGLWRWRDGWRIAAALPILVMGFVVLRIVVDTARDPTSHNLWPFEIVMWGVLGCGWMMALALARKLAGAGRAS